MHDEPRKCGQCRLFCMVASFFLFAYFSFLSPQVPSEYCPFMGPNGYNTNGKSFVNVMMLPAARTRCLTNSIGGSSTGLHQDGHGTVDSGHTVISGYNEVVMLRRIPEIHKIKACMMMPGLENSQLHCAEDILYGFPHDDYDEGVRC